MAAVDWQLVIDACDANLLAIAIDQQPKAVTYAGRTAQFTTIKEWTELRAFAIGQQNQDANAGDPTSVAEFGGFA